MGNLTGEMCRSAVIERGDFNGALSLRELRQVIEYDPFTCTMTEEPRGNRKHRGRGTGECRGTDK